MRTMPVSTPSLAAVGHRQRLGEALRLVVDAARADRVDVAPVRLRLRVHRRVAVHLRGGGEHEAGALACARSSACRVPRLPTFMRLDRQPQVVQRRGRRGEVQHPVDVAGDVRPSETSCSDSSKPRRPSEVLDVRGEPVRKLSTQTTSQPQVEQPLAEPGADEAGAAGHDRAADRTGRALVFHFSFLPGAGALMRSVLWRPGVGLC